jgi:glycosyltransferase involved in cell wall biosynthesis
MTKTNDQAFGNPIINTNKINIIYIGDGGVSDAVRLRLPANQLIDDGVLEGSFVNLAQFRTLAQVLESAEQELEAADMAVLTRPAIPELVEALKEKYEFPIVADIDDDFYSISKSHPGYMAVGPGNPDFLEGHRLCLGMADVVTVTTTELANRVSVPPLAVPPPKIRVIPNGWGDSEWWGRKYDRDGWINIGWGGTITHRSDFLLCKNVLELITQKYKYARLVIAGDPEIYKMFPKVKEDQKTFLPMVRYEDYPHTLMYYDILVAPLENNRFNGAKSDIKLVDAGAAKIPFVASDVPIYQDDVWNDGGYLVSGEDSWLNALEELVLHDRVREEKGKECRRAAEARHISVLASDWLDAYKEAIHCRNNPTSK